MSTDDLSAFFQMMKSKPENKVCFECGRNNPQWASVPFGILICLDCAGRHRSIGTHLSFVRSITMDTWNVEQLAKMRVGGNAACTQWFQKYGIANIPNLTQKFSSPAALAYKKKIEALCQNKPWVDPTDEEIKKFSRSTTNSLSSNLSNLSSSSPHSRSTSNNSGSNYSSGFSGGGNSGALNMSSGGYGGTPTGGGYSMSSAGNYGGSSSAGYGGISSAGGYGGYGGSSAGYNSESSFLHGNSGGYSMSSSGGGYNMSSSGGGYNMSSSGGYGPTSTGGGYSMSSTGGYGPTSGYNSESSLQGNRPTSIAGYNGNRPYTGENQALSKFSNSTAISSDEFFGRGKAVGVGGYQEGEKTNTLYNGWNQVTSAAQTAIGQVNLDSIQTALSEGSQKGLAMCVDYYNKAKAMIGESNYDNLNNKSSYGLSAEAPQSNYYDGYSSQNFENQARAQQGGRQGARGERGRRGRGRRGRAPTGRNGGRAPSNITQDDIWDYNQDSYPDNTAENFTENQNFTEIPEPEYETETTVSTPQKPKTSIPAENTIPATTQDDDDIWNFGGKNNQFSLDSSI